RRIEDSPSGGRGWSGLSPDLRADLRSDPACCCPPRATLPPTGYDCRSWAPSTLPVCVWPLACSFLGVVITCPSDCVCCPWRAVSLLTCPGPWCWQKTSPAQGQGPTTPSAAC